jgi:hypothetical protein
LYLIMTAKAVASAGTQASASRWDLFVWLGDNKDAIEALGHIGSLLGIFLVVAGLWLTWRTLRQQIQHAKDTDLAATQAYARQKFEDYLREAYANPDFLLDYWHRENLRPDQRERYRWFVKLTLWACEQVLKGYPDDPEWPEVVREHVAYHAAYLCSEYFNELPTYEAPVRQVINSVCATHRAESLAGPTALPQGAGPSAIPA